MLMGRTQFCEVRPGTSVRPESRVNRIEDKGINTKPYLPSSRKYLKDGTYTDAISHFVTPSGKIFASPINKGSEIEIEGEDGVIGPRLEINFLSFLEKIGVPRRDIFPQILIERPVGRAQEFSDGVVLFGNTAFLIQMKSRHSLVDGSYQSIEDPKRLGKKITEAKIQYYRSLSLARDFSDNKVKMTSLSGEKRIIDLYDYNWVSLVVVHRNYFEQGKKSITVSSKMVSPKTFGFDKVNHVILSLQGVMNLSKIFNTHYELLSYFKMLSTCEREYEICKESAMVSKVYGSVYGLEDNSLRLISILNKNINSFFNQGKLNKDEASLMLYPLYSSNRSNLEELFVNIENNFNLGTEFPLFSWNDKTSGYILKFDFSGRFCSLLRAGKIYEGDFTPIVTNDQFSHKDDIFKSGKDFHLKEIAESSIASNIDEFDEADATGRILSLIENYNDIAKPIILNDYFGSSKAVSLNNILIFGDTAYIVQVKKDFSIDNHPKLGLPVSDFDSGNFLIQADIDYQSKINFMKNSSPIAIIYDNNESFVIEFEKYNWVSLIVIEENGLGEKIESQLKINALPSSLTKSTDKRLVLSMNGFETIIQNFELSGNLCDFLRRYFVKSETYDLNQELQFLNKYKRQTYFSDTQTRYFIQLFNSIIIREFNNGKISKGHSKLIRSIFDEADDETYENIFSLIRKNAEKSYNTLDRFRFPLKSDQVIIWFSFCHSLSRKESKFQKLSNEFVSFIAEEFKNSHPKYISSFFLDLLRVNDAKSFFISNAYTLNSFTESALRYNDLLQTASYSHTYLPLNNINFTYSKYHTGESC